MKIFLMLFLISSGLLSQELTVGSVNYSLSGQFGNNYSTIAHHNPASGSGVIDSVSLQTPDVSTSNIKLFVVSMIDDTLGIITDKTEMFQWTSIANTLVTLKYGVDWTTELSITKGQYIGVYMVNRPAMTYQAGVTGEVLGLSTDVTGTSTVQDFAYISNSYLKNLKIKGFGSFTVGDPHFPENPQCPIFPEN